MDDINYLVNEICEIEEELKEMEIERNLKAKREKLKSILLSQLSGEVRKVEVNVDGINAKLFTRNNSPKVDLIKLKELLHPNTFRAVVIPGTQSQILEVKRAK